MNLKFLIPVFTVCFLLNFTTYIQAQANQTADSALSVDDVRVLKLTVKGMTCQKGCADGIDKKLKEVEGVKRSKTLLETGISRIVYDPKVLTPQKIKAMVEEWATKLA